MVRLPTGSSIYSSSGPRQKLRVGCQARGHALTNTLAYVMVCLLAVMLQACSTSPEQASHIDELIPAEVGNYRYEPWRPVDDDAYAAINVLMDEADVLMQRHAYEAAADKIERALRIKPDYAAAWSRLSWLALQTNSPKRSVFMAKRSNSLAHSDPALQSLNWTFIRAASREMNDEDAYYRANQQIESLKAF